VSAERTGSLRLDVVGAGPAYTDRPGATGASYLVSHAESAVLLDLGQGSFPRLANLLDPGELDSVLISHLHPDHFIDLVALRHYLRWGPDHPRRVRVIGPRGLGDRIDALHAEPGFSAAALDLEPLAPGHLLIGSLDVDVAPVTHAAESYAFRVALAGRPGLVYSGDCGRAEDLDVLMRPGDTLLSEVSFGPGPVPPGAAHMDGPTVGALAARTRAGRVLLTHLLMGHDEARTVASAQRAYDGPVGVVHPGDTFTLD
jgi:ribonuclease BN (tRNA processing enzyme)